MIFERAGIDGVVVIDLDRHEDERGFFARTFCAEEFAYQGLNTTWVQCNMSRSESKGTLRGIHYQTSPDPDIRLVRVTRGEIFGVVVDLRPTSPSFGRHVTRTLSAEDATMIYVPAGCGFGFQTLTDSTDMFYQMSVFFRPDLAGGVRWNDPMLRIRWPLDPTRISARDAYLPPLRDLAMAYS